MERTEKKKKSKPSTEKNYGIPKKKKVNSLGSLKGCSMLYSCVQPKRVSCQFLILPICLVRFLFGNEKNFTVSQKESEH